MPETTQEGEFTRLLGDVRRGDSLAEQALVALVYDELRAVARGLMARERAGHSLQPTELVNAVYCKGLRSRLPDLNDRRHFFSVAKKVMIDHLIDHARARAAATRSPPPATRSPRIEAGVEPRFDLLLDLDRALEKLGGLAPRQREVVEYRFYLGFTIQETAEQLRLSESAIEKDWRMARAWLFRRIGPGL
jgi:RNA polymerase sigma factor (TIGR02999 family)